MSRKAVIGSAVVLLLGLTLGLLWAGESKLSAEMKRIIAHHKTGEFDLKVEGLPASGEMDLYSALKQGFEVYKLPGPPGTADYFQYQVILDKAAARYWIVVSGGIAGIHRAYGPCLVKDLPASP